MAWTEERVETLKTLWAEGHSASQIAGRLGGVTRNAVIGKVHRLGLSGRAAPAKPKAVKAEAPSPTVAPRPAPRPRLETVGEPGRTTVGTLGTDQCKWPIGDPASEDFHFCGQGAVGGKPYCAYHSQLAFQPSSGRRDRSSRRPAALPASRKMIG